MFVAVSPSIAFPMSIDRWGYVRGLGDDNTDNTDSSSGGVPAAPIITGALSIANIAASSLPVSTQVEDSIAAALATAASVTPPPANLILGAAAGVAKLLATIGVGAGCGQACIKATQIVNQAEPAFLANVQQYEAGQISQGQAIATYNNLAQAMTVSCSAIPGKPGQDCAGDRLQPGSCKWKQTATGDTLGLPGVPAEGECWNWYSGYYLPLTYPAQTPYSGGAVSSAADSIAAAVGLPSGSGTLLLLAAAVGIALVVLT